MGKQSLLLMFRSMTDFKANPRPKIYTFEKHNLVDEITIGKRRLRCRPIDLSAGESK